MICLSSISGKRVGIYKKSWGNVWNLFILSGEMRGIVSGNQGYLESKFSKNRGILSECPLRKPYLPDRVMLSPMCSSRFFRFRNSSSCNQDWAKQYKRRVSVSYLRFLTWLRSSRALFRDNKISKVSYSSFLRIWNRNKYGTPLRVQLFHSPSKLSLWILTTHFFDLLST